MASDLGLRLITIEAGHFGTGSQQLLGDGVADTGGGPGDDVVLSRVLGHGGSPVSRGCRAGI